MTAGLPPAPGLPGEPWDPPEPGANGHHPGPFTRADMAALVRKPGRRPPVMADLVYAGKLHSIAGPPEAGKTILCLHLALAAMARSHSVVLFDHETGPAQVSDLLRAYGADPDMVAALLHYVPFPETAWRSPDIAAMHDMIAGIRPRPALVMFDSLGEMLAASGVKEIDPGEVTRFANQAFMPLATGLNCGVIITDHDAKGGETGTSRYARGTTAKLGKVDVMIKLEPVKAFSRDTDGQIRLTVTKDRPGCLHRWWDITVTRGPLTLTFTRGRPAAPGGRTGPAKDWLAKALTRNPLTIKQITDRYVHLDPSCEKGLRRETASRYLNELLAEGLADRIDQGPGREVLWLLASPGEPPPPDTDGGWGPDTNGAAAWQQDNLQGDTT